MDRNKLLIEFQHEFKAPEIKTFEDFLTLVGYNKQVRNWYSKRKKEFSTFVDMPDAAKNAGMTVEQWDNLEAERTKFRNINRIYNKEVNDASVAMVKAMENADANRLNSMQNISPIIKVLGMSVDNLPMVDQVQISMEKDLSERKKLQDSKLLNQQTYLIEKYLLDGRLPYDPFA